MATPKEHEVDRGVLLTPGERVGWVFREREPFRREFTEPEPQPITAPNELQREYETFRKNLPTSIWTVIGATAGVVVICAVCANVVDNPTIGLVSALALVIGVLVVLSIVAYYADVRRRANEAKQQADGEARKNLKEWRERRDRFEREEQRRIDRLAEWGSVSPGPEVRRVDVVGGDLWGWEALITVYGASLLATWGRLTVLDISGDAVGQELATLARDHQYRVDTVLLPDQLADSDLLAGLSTQELVDTLVEAIHSGADTVNLVDRSRDDRILRALCDSLGGDVSVPRLTAGLRVLMHELRDVSVLTDQERQQIDEGLFGQAFRQQELGRISFLESSLRLLDGLNPHKQPRPAAQLRVTEFADPGRAHPGLLTDLTVQWLMREVRRGDPPRSLMIAGADGIAPRRIERLSDLCDRNDVRLVLMYRRLRDAAVQTLGGGGAVGFMRMGNHAEAQRAADFIGREHRFVLSELTRTVGGGQTHTSSLTSGYSETESWSRSVSSTTGVTVSGEAVAAAASGGVGSATDQSASLSGQVTASEQRSRSATRSWSQTRGIADEQNWNDAATQQRVYEYAVEPRTLQEFPDYAMLLVRHRGTGPAVLPVDCNPDLISVPGFSIYPLPEVPVPEPSVVLDPKPVADPPAQQTPK